MGAHSTPKNKAVFVSECICKAMRKEKDGEGILERLALAVEQAAKVIEEGKQ